MSTPEARFEHTDDDGRWISDDGLTWLLVEPSPEYLERLAQYGESEPSEDETEQ